MDIYSGGAMKYTSHMGKRMGQRGFTKNMVDVLCNFGDSEVNTHKIFMNKKNIVVFYEQLYALEAEREQLYKQMRELNKNS